MRNYNWSLFVSEKPLRALELWNNLLFEIHIATEWHQICTQS